MGLTISSRSPAMAYSEGGLWVSTFDEIGRRCWVNNISGERAYQFVGGKPVTSTDSPYPLQQSPMPSPHAAPWARSMQSPVPPSPLRSPVPPSPGYPAPLVSNHGGGAGVMVPYQAAQAAGYGTGPPVTPTGNGGWAQRIQRCYVRPSSDRSWMWKSS